MTHDKLRHKSNVVRGGMLVVLLLTLFTMMSFTALAHAQKRQSSPLVAHLQHAPSGRADLRWNPQSQALTVTFHLSGLQPRSNHAAHIHAGICLKKGKILYPFKNVVANASGNGTSITTINHVIGGIPATGWHITVHRGPTAKTGDLLCGNVVNPQRATSVSVPLRTSP